MTTIAVDLAKNVFQLAFSDESGKITGHRRLSRPQFERFWSAQQAPACVVMEACSSAHLWGRRLRALGHQVLLLPAQYVACYVLRNKTDRADAEALLQALRDPRIKPVAVKSEEQQALAALHRVREQWSSCRTARINVIRGLLAEFGIIFPQGADKLLAQLPQLLEATRDSLPARLRVVIHALWREVQETEERLDMVDKELAAAVRAEPRIQTLMRITGIGPVTATALYAAIGDVRLFPSGRHLAAWMGLTPKEHSSGSKRHLGSISKQGDPYLRTLLSHGARSALLLAQRKAAAGKTLTYLEEWVLKKAKEQHPNRAVIALANKMARTVWAVWKYDRTFDGNHARLQQAA